MDKELDALLAAAANRGPRIRGDQGVGLRRLASDYAAFSAGTYDQPGWWEAKANAGTKLTSLCRWVINQPAAAQQVATLVTANEAVAAEGALVFGCLLMLTGHPRSAEFWWGYAEGAGDRTAAYCLYLRKLHHGELSDAQMWFERATTSFAEQQEAGKGYVKPSRPPIDNYFTVLSLFAKNAEAYGTAAARPDADLLAAIERIIHREDPDGTGTDGIAGRPDQDLVAALGAFTNRF